MTHSGDNGGAPGRWNGITRTYSSDDVKRLRGTAKVEHSLARGGGEKLWRTLHQYGQQRGADEPRAAASLEERSFPLFLGVSYGDFSLNQNRLQMGRGFAMDHPAFGVYTAMQHFSAASRQTPPDRKIPHGRQRRSD